MNTVSIDPKKCWRSKVTAEITAGHLEQIARELGSSLEGSAALEFLNQHGRAYEVWRVMMRAAEEYLQSELQRLHTPPAQARAWAAVHGR